MPSVAHIRLMMFVGEDQYNGEECNHFQVTDSQKAVSFGYIHRGYISYGFSTIRESQQGFRDVVKGIHEPPPSAEEEDDFDVSSLI